MLGLHGTTMTNGTRHQQRRRTPRVLAAAVMAGLILGAAACSSSPSNNATATTKATTTTIAIDPTTAQADIGTVYQTLFNLADPSVSGKVAVIQNGASITTALQQALSSSEASVSQGAKIDSVNILTASQCAKQSLPAQCAHVVYDILGTGGTAILPNNNGYAVFTGGNWYVAKATICTLLGLFYSAEGKTGTPPAAEIRNASRGTGEARVSERRSQTPERAPLRRQDLLGSTAVASPTTLTSPSPLANEHSRSTRFSPVLHPLARHHDLGGELLAGPCLAGEPHLVVREVPRPHVVCEGGAEQAHREHPVAEHAGLARRGGQDLVVVHGVVVPRRARIAHEIGPGQGVT